MPQNLLLVDDEALIHEVVAPALADAGFAVSSAVRAEEALLLIRRQDLPFCAIVTDVDLGPGLSGWDVARLARELIADIPVIYATGGRAHEHRTRGVPGSLLVPKPFAAEQILTALAALIAAKPAKIR